jgi:hypothetical protein
LIMINTACKTMRNDMKKLTLLTVLSTALHWLFCFWKCSYPKGGLGSYYMSCLLVTFITIWLWEVQMDPERFWWAFSIVLAGEVTHQNLLMTKNEYSSNELSVSTTLKITKILFV